MFARRLALALVLTAAAAAAGCAGDSQPAVEAVPAPADVAPAPVAEADAHPQEAHDDAHAAGHALGDVPVPDNHHPWTPDAPLMEGMSRVRAAVSGLEAAPDEAAVARHVAEVDEAIADMFANCRLEPEPDAALHVVLARLIAASRELQADPSATAPVAAMRAALANYEALFDDPAGRG